MSILSRFFSAEKIDYADIHSHLLYGIDDGAKSLDESVEMARRASKDGVTRMVATPHVSTETSAGHLLNEASERLGVLKERLAEEGIGLKVVLGAEVSLELGLADAVKTERRLTIGGNGRYMLVEMPAYGIPVFAEKVVFELLASGVVPVWAHPERCAETAEDHEFVRRFVESGVLLQLNSGSLLGLYGQRTRQSVKKMLANGLGDVMASDIHHASDTRRFLSAAFPKLAGIVGREKAVDMCSTLPAKIAGC
ncbi:MAG: hypothetical protein HY955_02860 [Deltaproteobacteria bacterium]|nr:hypothetical protein [Deltaproteobacteria bacterium]